MLYSSFYLLVPSLKQAFSTGVRNGHLWCGPWAYLPPAWLKNWLHIIR